MQTDIEKLQHIQPNFILGGVRFNLQSGNWRQLKLKSPSEFQHNFFNLTNQTYTIIKKSIFTFGLSNANTNEGALLSYNFVSEQNKQWLHDNDTNTPQYRHNYGLITFDGRLCMFGGQKDNQYYNDLMSFSSYTNIWLQVIKEDNPLLPSPRIPFIFTEVNNANLLLLGGFDGKDILKDAFLLINWSWKPLKFGVSSNTQQTLQNLQQIVNLHGIKFAQVKGNVYLFGGTNAITTYTNNLYKITINQQNLSLQITKILIDNGPRPCPRAHHSMQKLGQTCFAVYGGTNGIKQLRDLTIYDLTQNKWVEIYPFNGPLKILSKSILLYDYNCLYIIGEAMQKNYNGKQLIEISFPQFQLVKSQICTNCIRRLDMKQRQQVNGPKKPFVSNGLIYNMATQISFPFQAFALLIDCAQSLNSTQIFINSLQTTDQFSYLEIKFNGNQLTRQQFSSIVCHSYKQDPIILQLIDKIKLGALRLGKTMMFISIQGNFRRVFLFSADSLIISHYDQLYAYYMYEQRISDEWLATQQSIMHKKLIINLLKSYFKNPSLIINSVPKHCLLIFQNNVIMTSQKIYYGQLISSPLDINLRKNSKKVQFLDNIGFQLHDDPQVSLARYLEYLYLNTKIDNIRVKNQQLKLKSNRYAEQLEKLEQGHKIKQIYKNMLNIRQIQAECFLYQVTQPSTYTKQLKGILLYNHGRLINRLEINYGDLFWQKFYKTKYRHAFGLWTHVGIINFIKGVEVKTLNTEFKNQSNFNYFIRAVKKNILGKSKNSKRQINSEIQQIKYCKPQKKFKQ